MAKGEISEVAGDQPLRRSKRLKSAVSLKAAAAIPRQKAPVRKSPRVAQIRPRAIHNTTESPLLAPPPSFPSFPQPGQAPDQTERPVLLPSIVNIKLLNQQNRPDGATVYPPFAPRPSEPIEPESLLNPSEDLRQFAALDHHDLEDIRGVSLPASTACSLCLARLLILSARLVCVSRSFCLRRPLILSPCPPIHLN